MQGHAYRFKPRSGGWIWIEYVQEDGHRDSERDSASGHPITEHGADPEETQAGDNTDENGVLHLRQVATHSSNC